MVEELSMRDSSSSLFSNVHTGDLLHFGKNGSTDYQRVADFLNLSKKDVAKISGVSTKSVRWEADRIPSAVSERLQQIANICQLVADHFRDAQKTALWFKTPNPLLGNIAPRDMIRYGRYTRLLQFIVDARRQAHAESVGDQENKET